MTTRDYIRRLLSRALVECVREARLSDESLVKVFGVTPRYVRDLRWKDRKRRGLVPARARVQ